MAKRVITLLGHPVTNEDGAAGEAITPGMLVQGESTILKHASSAGRATPRFALEREEMGDDIDTAYAVGDTVKIGTFRPGDRVNALIASGVNMAAGTYLESAGDGTLKAVSGNFGIGRALEAVNNTAGPGTARLRVEVGL